MSERGVEVVVQIGGEDVLAGRLWVHQRRAAESATFTYTPAYLARSDAYELDPMLRLTEGQHQTPAGHGMFGAFTDCAPDRWGRRLIHRSEQARVKREGGAERRFGEIDYLLGVRDDLRQGALRFRDPETGGYLAAEDTGVPSLLELPKLLNAAERLERDEASETELRTLLKGGSSLGGARPKAHVREKNGRVAIAKFPSPANDDWEVMRWEAVAVRLARESGITVPDWDLHVIDDKAVLITDRFDRAGEIRVGYTSAMTMLEARDREQASYLDIAEVIENTSSHASKDLEELWRRVAFSILISNTDDHLRNHGFLRTTSAGWRLSPAFDLNPEPGPEPKYLTTAIDLDSTEARLDTLVGVAGFFRIGGDEARSMLGQVLNATREWRAVAEDMGLNRVAIDQMASAFEHGQVAAARRILETPVETR
jgi:serine/threonine-protein kinase HipA